MTMAHKKFQRITSPKGKSMILMSLNLRRMSNPSKKLALRRLVDPDVVSLQETLGDGKNCVREFKIILGD
jgi:hypothetical protein